MAGRRPKPLAIHKLNGNPRHMSKAELNGDDNPKPALTAPEMPKGLPRAARREFRRMVPLLQAIGVISEVDGLALAEYCRAHALIEQAQKEIDKNGMTFITHFEDKDGNVIAGDIKANPACSILSTQQKVMKSFLIEFGLTPASRSKLKITKKSDEDPMTQFLNRKTPSAPLQFTPPAPVAPEEMEAGGDEEDKSSS